MSYSQKLGINHDNAIKIAEILNNLLYSEFNLFIKTREYHWNVQSDNFMEFHKLYQSQYEAIDNNIDEIAERIRTLGEMPKLNFDNITKFSLLEMDPEPVIDDKIQLGNLQADHLNLVRAVRVWADQVASLGDSGTNDFLIGILQYHEKTAWILTSYLGQ